MSASSPLPAHSSNLETKIIFSILAYLQQIDNNKPVSTTSNILEKYPEIKQNFLKLFQIRFDPDNIKPQEELIEIINQNISSVNGIAQGTDLSVLSSVLKIILAISRTNAYLKKNYISFKINSSKLPDLPKPIPYAEIFVFSDDFEGMHLRAGKVARGGLRWSDREKDYRTEVLGLMKAQHVKNCIIVPVGAKGVFFIKKLDSVELPQQTDYVMNCYKDFLRGLLDITDNIIDGKIIPSKGIISYDEHDPYLVVAADKGTATFSDYANEVAKEYNFWLGDAFASGSSSGYDHKQISITSKGAWVSLLDHLKTANLKLEDTKFLGIGDMSGDVFGNGMLSSDKINLVAAFDHRHIFIDPNPINPKASFAERKRLFDKPRSNWSDYNPNLISQGGGVFPRKLESIQLTPEIKSLLNTDKNSITPDELIKSLLTSSVDIIWNGGIGTYVKASFETHDEISDKHNDHVRVDAKDIQAKIIVEGGNLGVSQHGRIEFALSGGKINADFIDNSGGVNCSDHEVNIKICLAKAIKNGHLDQKDRNKIIAEMTDEVVKHVLVSNYDQAQSITIMEHSPIFNWHMFSNNISYLEKKDILERDINCLPSQEEIQKRKQENKNITRPEIAMLLSYSKKYVYNNLLISNVIKDSYFQNKILPRYFPQILQSSFPEEIREHELHNEIAATIIANKMINQLSGAIIIDLIKTLHKPVATIAKAFVVVSETFRFNEKWNNLLHSSLDMEEQVAKWSEMITLAQKSIKWVINNHEVETTSINKMLENSRATLCAWGSCQ